MDSKLFELNSEILNCVKNIRFESNNAFSHLNGVIENRILNCEQKILEICVGQSNEILHQILAMRADSNSIDQTVFPQKPKVHENEFSEVLDKVKASFPSLFDLWHERLMAASDAFTETAEGNAANWGDIYSVAFRNFVRVHGQGQVLDVGCGVYGKPMYLDGFSSEQISGLDPLPNQQTVDFTLVQGVGEYLPWDDQSFDTVISATSLDHSLSLSGSLNEMERVLVDDGMILLWIGSIPGSPEFLPDDKDFVPSDKFHLFHFDTTWFDPLLSQQFNILDRLVFWGPHHSHVFYAMCKKR